MELALEVAANQAGEDVGEVGVGVDAAELAALDQAGDDRPVVATSAGLASEPNASCRINSTPPVEAALSGWGLAVMLRS